MTREEEKAKLAAELRARQDKSGQMFAPTSSHSSTGEIGKDGEDGEDGRDGADGTDGLDGEDGRDGADGKDGEDGKDAKGEVGCPGTDGVDGKDGTDGVAGKDGRSGVDGKDGPPGPPPSDKQVKKVATPIIKEEVKEEVAKNQPTVWVGAGGGTGGGTTPTGTGFRHVIGGVESAASKVVDLASADVTGVLPDANVASTIARDAEVTTEIATHAAAADPHTGYQKESEKGAASGYAGLTVGTKLNLAQMQGVMAHADLTDNPANELMMMILLGV